MNGRFYVYLWLDPRTMPMMPRYVGKGADGRAWTFNRKRDKNARLHYMMTELKRVRKKPYVLILDMFDTEEESFAAEIAAIKEYGREDLGTGTLFNCSAGGRGNSSIKNYAPKHTLQRRAASSKRMSRLNADPKHQAKAHHKKRTDPATRAVLSERMKELNNRPDFHSAERRAAASEHLTKLNQTRIYSPGERAARSARTTAMNEARAAAKRG